MNKKLERGQRKTKNFFAVLVALVLIAASAFSAWSLANLTGKQSYMLPDTTVVYGLMPGAKHSVYSSSADNLRIEAMSVELDLGISVLYVGGRLVEGICFEFTIVNKEDESKVITIVDDDMDGQIYIEEIEEGEYTVTLTQRDDITVPSPVVVTVEPKVAYEKVDVSDQVKTYDEINGAEEEKQYGGGTNSNGGSAPAQSSDTVEYVESSRTTTTNQVEKAVLDSEGNQVYKYKPELSANGFLIDASGVESNIIPILDSNGYITGAKRVDPATLQDVDCTAEVLDAKGAPLMSGDTYKYKFTKVALTEIVTETVTVYKGWQTIDGNTYYYDKNGNYVTGWQTIQGIRYFFRDNGVRGASVGIDVSTWQGNIDWVKVKAAGVDFAFIRLGFRGYGSGALVLDDYFHKNMQGAIAAGIKVGVYFFTQAITEKEAVEEASMCLQYVAGYSLSYPIAIDIEDAGSPSARTNSLTNEQRTKICTAFCETIKNSGYTAAVYANKYYFESKLNTSQLNKYIIWLAHYTSATSSSYGGRYDIWQHTSVGKVNGVSGNCDMNVSYIGY